MKSEAERCHLDEALLLAYVMGDADQELKRAVERSPACRAAAARLAREAAPLLHALYRGDCPDVTTLIRYQERQLEGTAQLVLRQHLLSCAVCREEYDLLASIDTVAPSMTQRVRRVVEAIFRPPQQLAAPLRGDLLHYQAPAITIVLSMRKTSGEIISWSLRGEARTPDGRRAAGMLEAVFLRTLPPQPPLDQPGTVAPNGTFAVQPIAAGRYSLHLLTPDEEVVIRQMIIGDLDEAR